ncbi:MAG: TonB-dependent receptor plug domain-containing protein [Opitutaceae bacterium]|nr:TonB-dependent receptor plug domain-containing protein [Opitutaceae bacterium]
MNSNNLRLHSLAALACIIPLLAPCLHAQSTAPDAVTLAKYDTNKNGRLDPDELVAMDAAQRAPKPAEIPSASNDEPIVISPFEVTDTSRGYYASSTMSGTRLNSKVEDLASSITVVTKEQMSDFAMLDINDVFMYEAGTEGTATFTDFSVDRNGSPVDNTSLNPNGSNRVRGVGPANISFGNFETSGRVPIDPINIDALEISRGPNSTVFGLGNAGGTVNMQPASANVTRDRSQLSARVDSYDGYRTSLDLNRVLKKGVLALRGSAVYQHDGFVRKPSGTDTTRLNGMVRYQPFKYTSLTASHSYYHMEGTRTNVTMPRDAVSGWRKAGSPTWDPVTTSAKINGVRVPGTFTATSLPAFFSNANFRTLSTLFIDPSGDIGFWSPSRTTSATTPDTGNQNIVLVNTVPEPIRATQPLFSSDPSVNSKELYDYSSFNLAAMNSNDDHTLTTHLQLEQIFLDTPRNLLALQAGYYRENSKRRFRSLLGTPGSSGATGFLHVDVNERMIDGSPNPYFLHPFIGIYNVKAHRDNPNRRETARLQLAYRLDLRHEKNFLRWLGMQQVSAYGEYKDSTSRTTQYRDQILSEHAWLPRPATAQRGTNFTPINVARVYYRYYVGDANGQNVDYAPRDFTPGATYPYRWGNGVTQQFVTEQAKLGSGYWFDSVSGWSRSLLKTNGAVLQSHFLKDRVVTTFGWRKDHTFNHGAADPMYLSGPDGVFLDPSSLDVLDDDGWVKNQGPTKTAGVVVKPLTWFHLHYNQSDSFQPAGLAFGLFLNPLPNPTGEGKDYGFSVNLMQGKLVMRVNKYETTQFNSRNGSTRTLAQRVRSLDFDAPYSNVGLTVRARDWVTNAAAAQGQTLSPDEINRRVSEIAKLDASYFTRAEDRNEQNSLVAETGDVTAKGIEFELNFNPTQHWTTKFNVTQTESIDSNLSPNLNRWIDERRPVWESIIDPEIGRPWFTERYANTTSASQYLQSNVISQLRIANATEGKSRPQIRKYRANMSTSYRLAGISDHPLLKRFTVGGAIRWEDKGAIGYYGIQQLPDIILDLDPSRPIYDKARTYGDLFVAYRTKLFANKANATLQLNVRNIQESGRLQPISAFPDGTPNGYRIVDPRQFILTATFDL